MIFLGGQWLLFQTSTMRSRPSRLENLCEIAGTRSNPPLFQNAGNAHSVLVSVSRQNRWTRRSQQLFGGPEFHWQTVNDSRALRVDAYLGPCRHVTNLLKRKSQPNKPLPDLQGGQRRSFVSQACPRPIPPRRRRHWRCYSPSHSQAADQFPWDCTRTILGQKVSVRGKQGMPCPSGPPTGHQSNSSSMAGPRRSGMPSDW